MSFGSSAFGTTPFGASPADLALVQIISGAGSAAAESSCSATSSPHSGNYVIAGAGQATGSSACSATGFDAYPFLAIDPHWFDVVFLSHFNDYPLGATYGTVIDEVGHTVVRSENDQFIPNSALGGHGLYRKSNSTTQPRASHVAGLLPEFNGFSATDSWTIEFRSMARTSQASFDLLAIHPTNPDVTPLFFRFQNGAVDGEYIFRLQAQGSTYCYVTDVIGIKSLGYIWKNIVVESDGSGELTVAVNGVVYPLTVYPYSGSELLYSPDALTLLSRTAAASTPVGAYLDELRITKASRYNGSGYPTAQTVEFPDPRSTMRVAGTGGAPGEAFANAGSEVVIVGNPTGVAEGGSSAVAKGAAVVPVSPSIFGDSLALGAGVPIRQGLATASGESFCSGYGAGRRYAFAAGSAEGGSEATASGRRVNRSSSQAIGVAHSSAGGASVRPRFGQLLGDSSATATGVPVSTKASAGTAHGESFCHGRSYQLDSDHLRVITRGATAYTFSRVCRKEIFCAL